ncbi:hypothetical protein [Bosea lathyri]|uniref:hypothetical protein n=1 Tax=Bosea lathyri TaxID=1036778 RepID=UPI0011AFFCAC|nr:hypothetical protein [Bosea lathyri]
MSPEPPGSSFETPFPTERFLRMRAQGVFKLVLSRAVIVSIREAIEKRAAQTPVEFREFCQWFHQDVAEEVSTEDELTQFLIGTFDDNQQLDLRQCRAR